MKRLIFLSTCLLMVICSLTAQNKKPAITFEKTTHDFGTFDESKGKVTTEFTFKNTGNAPLLITRTAASCGCTTPEYPKEPIAPGGKGVIKVTYNAKGRPGVFQKTVYVIANTDPEKSTLIIKGKVIPTPPKKEDAYPKEVSGLRLKKTHVPFFDVYPNTVKEEVVEVYNPGNTALHLTFPETPKHMKVVALPASIPAKGEGKIQITYYPEKAKDWGMKKDFFLVQVNGAVPNVASDKITVTADIREDFSTLSKKELENAPALSLSNSTLDFGNVSEKSTKTIQITNTGKSELVIRKVNNESNLITANVNRKTIQPGKTADLKVTINPTKASARNINNRIFLITNAPESASTTIRIKGTVQ